MTSNEIECLINSKDRIVFSSTKTHLLSSVPVNRNYYKTKLLSWLLSHDDETHSTQIPNEDRVVFCRFCLLHAREVCILDDDVDHVAVLSCSHPVKRICSNKWVYCNACKTVECNKYGLIDRRSVVESHKECNKSTKKRKNNVGNNNNEIATLNNDSNKKKREEKDADDVFWNENGTAGTEENAVENGFYQKTVEEEIESVFSLKNEFTKHVCNYIIAKEKKESCVYMIQKCVFKNMHMKPSHEDALLFLKIIKAMLLMSRTDQKLHADIYSGIVLKFLRQKHTIARRISSLSGGNLTSSSSSSTNEVECNEISIPTSARELRYHIEEKFGLVNSLIIPMVSIVKSTGYAFIKPSNGLRIGVSLGAKIELVKETTSIDELKELCLHHRSAFHTEVVQKTMNNVVCKQEDVYFCPIAFWRDGSSMGGLNKGGRNGALLATFFIMFFENLTPDHVFFCSFGRKADDHDEVLKTVFEDFAWLAKTPIRCYVPELKKSVLIRFVLCAVICDR